MEYTELTAQLFLTSCFMKLTEDRPDMDADYTAQVTYIVKICIPSL